MKQLKFTDAKTFDTVLITDIYFDEDDGFYFNEDSSGLAQTFWHEIECALYCINEGNMTKDSIDGDDSCPYMYWEII